MAAHPFLLGGRNELEWLTVFIEHETAAGDNATLYEAISSASGRVRQIPVGKLPIAEPRYVRFSTGVKDLNTNIRHCIMHAALMCCLWHEVVSAQRRGKSIRRGQSILLRTRRNGQHVHRHAYDKRVGLPYHGVCFANAVVPALRVSSYLGERHDRKEAHRHHLRESRETIAPVGCGGGHKEANLELSATSSRPAPLRPRFAITRPLRSVQPPIITPRHSSARVKCGSVHPILLTAQWRSN